MSKVDTESTRYEKRKVSDLVNWEDNPRYIPDEKEYQRLKDQIIELGVYKPLVINQQNIVLGGNMRLRAFKELGVDEVMCSVVLTDNRAQMLQYALADNDHVGVTDVEKVQELATIEPIKSELFAVNSKPMKLVSDLKRQAGPDGSNGASQEPKCRECPLHCGMENI